MTLLELINSIVAGGMSLVGMNHGFVGLFAGLIAGFAMVGILDWIPLMLARFGNSDLFRSLPDELVIEQSKRAWLSFYPPCDLRDLLYHRWHLFMESMSITFCATMIFFQHPMRFGFSPFVEDVIRFAVAICAAILTGVLTYYGLWILWGRTAIRLGATNEVSSNLSKPVEMIVCYLLLVAGFALLTIVIYVPFWIQASLL